MRKKAEKKILIFYLMLLTKGYFLPYTIDRVIEADKLRPLMGGLAAGLISTAL